MEALIVFHDDMGPEKRSIKHLSSALWEIGVTIEMYVEQFWDEICIFNLFYLLVKCIYYIF